MELSWTVSAVLCMQIGRNNDEFKYGKQRLDREIYDRVLCTP